MDPMCAIEVKASTGGGGHTYHLWPRLLSRKLESKKKYVVVRRKKNVKNEVTTTASPPEDPAEGYHTPACLPAYGVQHVFRLLFRFAERAPEPLGFQRENSIGPGSSSGC